MKSRYVVGRGMELPTYVSIPPSYTESMKIFFKPSGGPISRVIMAMVPLLSLLVYLLYLAWKRSDAIPYTAPADATEQEITEGYQAEIDALVPMEEMIWVFLSICLLSTYTAVNLTFFLPRKTNLIKRFLREGNAQLGDLFYKGRNCALTHEGEVIYPHPNYKICPIYFRRTVHVHDHYSKEKTTILLLPEEAKSGHVKSDIEAEAKRIKKNEGKMRWLMVLAWLWTVFTSCAPIYVLHIMRRADDEVSKYDEMKLLYLIAVLAVIPVISVLGNIAGWLRYYSWMTRGDAQAAEDGDYLEWADVKGVDYEIDDYHPPTPSSSGRLEESAGSTDYSDA